MPAPAWEDQTAFLQLDEFATPVELRLTGGEVRTVCAIFDDPFLDAQLGEYVLETQQPRLTCREADVAGAVRGDRAVIDGVTFDVLGAADPDGTGMATLLLARVPA